MIRSITWLLAAALGAIVTHIAYVLFLPSYEMNEVLGGSVRAVGVNRFGVLEAAQQETILKESARSMIAGVCPFDLSDGTLIVDVSLPDALWSLTVYGDNGKDAYAINEAQAGTNQFRLTVKRTPSLIATILGGSGDTTVPDDGWTAMTSSRRGLAVVLVALDDRQLRPAYADLVKKSSCHIESRS
jgi:uncharacterized membrane protein